MRIALAHAYPWDEVHRGAERYLGDLAWYLAGAGHEVHVLTTGRPRRTETVDGVPIHRLPRIEGPRLAWRGLTAVETQAMPLVTHLARHRYDVVHTLAPAAVLAARLSRHRCVFTELGHPTVADLETRRWALPLYRWATRSATTVTALTHSAAQAVRAVTPRVDIRVLNPGVRLERFEPDLRPRTGPPRLLFVSDASEYRKGIHWAVAALARLLDREPGARLVLGGPGDHEWARDHVTPEARFAFDAVEDLGVVAQEELPALYRSATVTLLPSTHEAFGLVLAESLACGTPVVCTRAAGMPEVVDDEVGRMFAPGDVDGFATAMSEAIEMARDPSVLERCAR
ncbi:MAG: glycosyltransferase family 4 protein, partial [Acidimicrobiia bacterium]